ncbi:MAG TPA: hypothetical protein VFZ58_00475 [Candidatus Saccharimonadales bacterium]
MVVVGLFWFFGARQETIVNQKPKASAEASAKEKPPAEVPPLTIEVAKELANDLLSSDPTTYKTIWSRSAGLPMPPNGTLFTLHEETLQFNEVAGYAKATLVMPGKDPSEVNVLFEHIGQKWKIRTIQ